MLVFPLPELVFIDSMQVVVHQPKNTENKNSYSYLLTQS